MKLKLHRPIIFFDIEATGLDTQYDRIVELAITKLFPDGTRQSKCRRINPQIPIPAKATEIHGITNADVAGQPSFSEIANSLHDQLQDCDIGGFNSNKFDIPMLYFEFLRAGIQWNYHQHHFIDVQNIFKRKEERTLTAALKFYCSRTLEGAHAADADTEATVDVFLAQLERYPDLPQTLEDLALFTNYDKPVLDVSGKFSTDDDGDIVFNFGSSRGEKALENPSLLEWMIYKGFPEDSISICRQLLDQIYNH